jgi:hypothetical protein
LEAGRAHKQLAVLRKQEEKRQQKAIRARQISERQVAIPTINLINFTSTLLIFDAFNICGR